MREHILHVLKCYINTASINLAACKCLQGTKDIQFGVG